jgi:YVTN family beta-propeller protein
VEAAATAAVRGDWLVLRQAVVNVVDDAIAGRLTAISGTCQARRWPAVGILVRRRSAGATSGLEEEAMNARRTRVWTRVSAVLVFGTAAAAVPAESRSDAAEVSCAWITSFGGNDVCGIAVPSGESLGCVTTGSKPHGVALSADGSRLYVSNEGTDTMTVVDTVAKRAVAEVRVGRQPNQVALDPPGEQLRVLNKLTAEAQTYGFDGQKAGEPPKGMTCALTGKGRPGAWKVLADTTAPSPPHVLAQGDDDGTSYRFPVCVVSGLTAVDLDLSVRFKPVAGSVDQAAGLVFRYRDPDNYYIVRANALENNVVLYKVENGKRSDLDPRGAGAFAYGKKAPVPSRAWSTLRVVARRGVFETYLNGEKLFDVDDATFTAAGQVGVWTKADSVTYFDDLALTIVQ